MIVTVVVPWAIRHRTAACLPSVSLWRDTDDLGRPSWGACLACPCGVMIRSLDHREPREALADLVRMEREEWEE